MKLAEAEVGEAKADVREAKATGDKVELAKAEAGLVEAKVELARTGEQGPSWERRAEQRALLVAGALASGVVPAF